MVSAIDGGYTEWLEHPCSTTCGCGVRRLTRSCTNPPPQDGGKPCAGDSEKTESCNLGRCGKLYLSYKQLGSSTQNERLFGVREPSRLAEYVVPKANNYKLLAK